MPHPWSDFKARITRPDAVKYYYREIIKSPKSDSFSYDKLLTFEEYIQCKPDWFIEEAWESICKY